MSLLVGQLVPMADIKIGEHVVRHGFNLDTIWATLIAVAVLLILAFVARKALTRTTKDHVPTKVQLVWESIVDQVNAQVKDALGEVHPFVAPLAVSLFFFILICNWLELLPTDFGSGKLHITPAPTGDVNLTYAMALLVFVSTWVYGMRRQGVLGYFKGFAPAKNPDAGIGGKLGRGALTALNTIEELIKPVTLALRLFGNIFAGGIMLLLIAALMSWHPSGIPVGGVLGFVMNIVWKLFDMFIGGIQAFIFALLTVLYFSMAAAGHGDHSSDDHGDDHAHDVHPEPAHAGSPQTVA